MGIQAEVCGISKVKVNVRLIFCIVVLSQLVLALKRFMYSGPGAKWPRGPLRSRLEIQLGSAKARIREHLNLAELGKLVTQFPGGDNERVVDLWRIFSVEFWLRRYF